MSWLVTFFRRFFGPADYFRRETISVGRRKLRVRELSSYEHGLVSDYMSQNKEALQTELFAYTASLCCEDLQALSVDDIRARFSDASLMTIQSTVMRLSGFMPPDDDELPDQNAADDRDPEPEPSADEGEDEEKKSGPPTVGFSSASH